MTSAIGYWLQVNDYWDWDRGPIHQYYYDTSTNSAVADHFHIDNKQVPAAQSV